jgi:hypothetical protein
LATNSFFIGRDPIDPCVQTGKPDVTAAYLRESNSTRRDPSVGPRGLLFNRSIADEKPRDQTAARQPRLIDRELQACRGSKNKIFFAEDQKRLIDSGK